jgi:hypothetical protein
MDLTRRSLLGGLLAAPAAALGTFGAGPTLAADALAEGLCGETIAPIDFDSWADTHEELGEPDEHGRRWIRLFIDRIYIDALFPDGSVARLAQDAQEWVVHRAEPGLASNAAIWAAERNRDRDFDGQRLYDAAIASVRVLGAIPV